MPQSEEIQEPLSTAQHHSSQNQTRTSLIQPNLEEHHYKDEVNKSANKEPEV